MAASATRCRAVTCHQRFGERRVAVCFEPPVVWEAAAARHRPSCCAAPCPPLKCGAALGFVLRRRASAGHAGIVVRSTALGAASDMAGPACDAAPASPAPSRFVVRDAVASDAESLSALDAACAASGSSGWSASTFEASLRQRGSTALVATPANASSGQLLGFVVGVAVVGELSVENLATAPDARGRGVATELVRQLLRRHSLLPSRDRDGPSEADTACGAAVADAVEQDATAHGTGEPCLQCQVCILEVKEGNASAVSLYRRIGFVEVGRRAKYYTDGSAALLMQMPADTTESAL